MVRIIPLFASEMKKKIIEKASFVEILNSDEKMVTKTILFVVDCNLGYYKKTKDI